MSNINNYKVVLLSPVLQEEWAISQITDPKVFLN